jgi:hypothetical protein
MGLSIMTKSNFNRELKTKKNFVKKTVFKEMNNFMNNDIPDSLVKFIDESFETQYPENIDELIKLRDKINHQYKALRESSASESNDLEDPCKFCIEKMVNQLYDLRPGIGIGNHLWKEMSKIWQFNEVLVSIFSLEKIAFNKLTTVYHLREAYKTSYEFTIKFLIEFAYQIALEKEKNKDKSSITFIKNYRRSFEKTGGKPMKRDLIVYLRQQKYLDKDTCLFLQNSLIRDSICHANVYFDEKTDLLTFGNIKISLEEFKKHFEDMYKINQYLVSQNLERAAKEKPQK